MSNFFEQKMLRLFCFRPGARRVLALRQLAVRYQFAVLVIDHDAGFVVILLALDALGVSEV